MTVISFSELSLKSEGELRRLLNETQTKLADLRMQAAAGSLRNVREIRALRLAIAQMLTRLRSLRKS